MIEYIKIEQDGYLYKIPKRDDIDDWRECIVIWKNEGVSHEQVQRSIDKCVEEETLEIRENKIENLIDETQR